MKKKNSCSHDYLRKLLYSAVIGQNGIDSTKRFGQLLGYTTLTDFLTDCQLVLNRKHP